MDYARPLDLLKQIDWSDRRNLYIALTAPVVGLTFLNLLGNLWHKKNSPVLVSPRKSLQLLAAAQLEDIPYPSDALPGGRDVDTPYGNIRVYEWGPEDGRKVLCIHGISTPSISFARMAKELVEEGCRVMTFDLFGRGYSDAPDPTQYPQNISLFTTQILLVLASSPLAWHRFSLIGYSLGGGIAMNFTSYLPHLVTSLILIAPSGLIRPKHISATSKLLYGRHLPESLVEAAIRRRLTAGTLHPTASSRKPTMKPPPPTTTHNNDQDSTAQKTTITPDVDIEVPDADAANDQLATATAAKSADHPAHIPDSSASIFPGRPKISVADAVRWQTEAHPGFLKSFISSIRFAPVLEQHERWRLVAARQAAARASEDPDVVEQSLDEGRVLLLLGRDDQVIVSDEVAEDAVGIMGRENVEVVKLRGAHDVPIVNAEGCVDAIVEFWGM